VIAAQGFLQQTYCLALHGLRFGELALDAEDVAEII